MKREDLIKRMVAQKDTIKLTNQRIGTKSPIVCETRAGNNDDSRATISGIGKCLDYILEGKVNAVSAKDGFGQSTVYVEYESENKLYSALFDGHLLEWEKEAPSDYGLFLPILFHALTYHNIPELSLSYNRLINHGVQNAGVGGNGRIMSIFCDTFHLDVMLELYPDIEVLEDVSEIVATTKRAYIRGMYEICPTIEMVPNKKNLEIIDTLESPKENKVFDIDNWEDCLTGQYRIPFSWPDEMKDMIPNLSVLEEYYPVDQFFRILHKVRYRMTSVLNRLNAGKKWVDAIGEDYLNLTLTGKPGTGKTVLLYNLAAALGLPVCSINISKNTDEDVFQGMNKIVDGQLSFVETDFLKFYQNGGIIILEEVNLCDPAVTMGALGQALEYPFILKKDGYETIRRHPLCIICSTKNVGTYGAKDMNQAFSNRFPYSYLMDDPKTSDFVSILEKHGFEKHQCEWVVGAYEKIARDLSSPQYESEEIVLSLSIRTCIAALRSIEEGTTPKTALADTFIGKIAETDIEIAEELQLFTDNYKKLW